jgi:ABC-2 type transport system ATP-binding protein
MAAPPWHNAGVTPDVAPVAPLSSLASTDPSAIETHDLTKRFGQRRAVDSLSIQVPRGVIAGLVGPNGAGKTTTLRLLLGLIRPTGGNAAVLGQSIHQPREFMHRVGALIEGPAFYPTLSGRTNLSTLATLGRHGDADISELLQTVGLADRGRDMFRSYSLGMKQRLGIAAALLSDPELLILDEPANGLDPPGIIEMRDLLRRLRAGGKTLLVSSHLLAEVDQIADWLIVLVAGKAVYCGPAADLPGRQSSEILVATESPAQLDVVVMIARDRGYTAVVENGQVRIAAPSSFAGELNRLTMQAGATLVELHQVQSTLEESFLQIIGSVN